MPSFRSYIFFATEFKFAIYRFKSPMLWYLKFSQVGNRSVWKSNCHIVPPTLTRSGNAKTWRLISSQLQQMQQIMEILCALPNAFITFTAKIFQCWSSWGVCYLSFGYPLSVLELLRITSVNFVPRCSPLLNAIALEFGRGWDTNMAAYATDRKYLTAEQSSCDRNIHSSIHLLSSIFLAMWSSHLEVRKIIYFFTTRSISYP